MLSIHKAIFIGVMTTFITSKLAGAHFVSPMYGICSVHGNAIKHQPNLGKHAQSNAWYWKFSIKWDILVAIFFQKS